MTEEPLIIPLPREHVDTMIRASMFAHRIIGEAMANTIDVATVLDAAQEFGLQNRRKMTAEERADPVAISRLLGVDLDAADVLEPSLEFQGVLDSIVFDEETSEAES